MFSRAVKLFEILGFQIKVDPSWLLIAALIVWSLSQGYFPDLLPDRPGSVYMLLAVLAMLGLFLSLILHELSHSVVARRFGVGIGGITLFLFGGVAELDEEPHSAGSEFWIAVAGPAMSFALAGLSGLGWLLADAAAPGSAISALLLYLATVNLVLAVFNLLPAFPLDGGRVFRAWLWNRSGDVVAATRRASAVGQGIANVLILLGLLSVLTGGGFGGLWMVLIGLFLMMASRSTYEQLLMKAGLKERKVAQLMSPRPWTAGPDISLAGIADGVMLRHAVSFVPIVSEGTLLGVVDIHTMRQIPRDQWAETPASAVMVPTGPDNTIAPGMPALSALKLLSGGAQRKFLVAEDRHLVGVLSLRDLLGFIAVMRELREAPEHQPPGA